MRDHQYVQFLQWALPQLRMRWKGFRKVRRQVCRRIQHRIAELGLFDLKAYRSYLEREPSEWAVLDAMCRVTISRFFRDKEVFECLGRVVFPDLGVRVSNSKEPIRCWSSGCASGEEPYSLALLWNFCVASRFPEVGVEIIGTDIDPLLLGRARSACYSFSSIRDLPHDWRERAFRIEKDRFCLKKAYTRDVYFTQQDVRSEAPDGLFHMIFCRNLAFTYYEQGLQKEVVERLLGAMVPGGALVIGAHEALPEDEWGFWCGSRDLGVYRCSKEGKSRGH